MVYRKIAEVITVVFQPLIVPSAVMAILLYVIPEATSIPIQARRPLLALVMVTTLLIPMLSVVGMKMTSLIPSIRMPTHKERLLPFSMVSLFYVITSSYFYYRMNLDPLFMYTLGVITICVLILTVITFWWKISAHLTGMGGMLAIVLVLGLKYSMPPLLYCLIISVMLCGIVASARLYLNAHKPAEVGVGFMLGFSVCFTAYYHYFF